MGSSKTSPRTKPLVCRSCQRTGKTSRVTVSGAGQYRQIRGKRTKVVRATCTNGHEFWLSSKEAVRRSEASDARREKKLA